MTHYGEQLVREFEAAYEKEIFRRADAPLRAKPMPLPRRRSPERLFAQLTACHPGLRAARLCESTADLRAHPEVFRCPRCNMLLDPPVWDAAC